VWEDNRDDDDIEESLECRCGEGSTSCPQIAEESPDAANTSEPIPDKRE